MITSRLSKNVIAMLIFSLILTGMFVFVGDVFAKDKAASYTLDVNRTFNSTDNITLMLESSPISLEISGLSNGTSLIKLGNLILFNGSGEFIFVGEETGYLENTSQLITLDVSTNGTLYIESIRYETLVSNNAPILIEDIPSIAFIDNYEMNLNNYFYDEDKDKLEFIANYADGLNVTIENKKAVFNGEVGKYAVEIIASDGIEFVESNSFIVDVVEVENVTTTTLETNVTTSTTTTTDDFINFSETTTTLGNVTTTSTTSTTLENITTTTTLVNLTTSTTLENITNLTTTTLENLTTTTSTTLENITNATTTTLENVTTTSLTTTTLQNISTSTTTSTTTTTLENNAPMLINNIPDITFIGSYVLIMHDYFFDLEDDFMNYTINSTNINLSQEGEIVTLSGEPGIYNTVITATDSNSTLSNNFTIEIVEEEIITPKIQSDNFVFTSKEKPKFKIQYLSKNNKTKKNITSKILDSIGKNTNIKPNLIKTKEGTYELEIDTVRSFKPGKYKLQVKITENGKTYLLEQDFLWGVLALNTDKSIYLENEIASIGIGVLDDEGRMVCDADVDLEIISPTGIKTLLSTSDRSISISPECEIYGITDLPDYYTTYQTKEKGIYQLKLTANTYNGLRETTDYFEVKDKVKFDVRREGPTRIFPLVPYSMNLEIKANENYKGIIKEHVPSGFEIPPQNNLYITTKGDTKTLAWDVDLKEGDIINLNYEFDAPDISPEFYLLGELEIGQWKELRQWQIASDAVWNSNNLGTFDWNTAPDVTFEIVDGSGVPDFTGALTKVSIRLDVTTGKNLDNGDGIQCYHCETAGCSDTFDFGSLTVPSPDLNTEAVYYLNSTSSTLFSRIEHNGVDSEFVRCVLVGTDDGGDDLIADIYVDLEYNLAPNTPTVSLTSTDEIALTSSTLNCSSTISDTESDNLNVTVRWFENGTQKLELDYNNSYSSGSLFNATLSSSYTNPGDNWSCKINVTDGNTATGFVTSSNLSIIQYGKLDVSIAHPTDDLGVAQNTNFYINATINCTGEYATCGTVYATARYNKTTASADENISIVSGATPFYSFYSNPSSYWDIINSEGDGGVDSGGGAGDIRIGDLNMGSDYPYSFYGMFTPTAELNITVVSYNVYDFAGVITAPSTLKICDYSGSDICVPNVCTLVNSSFIPAMSTGWQNITLSTPYEVLPGVNYSIFIESTANSDGTSDYITLGIDNSPTASRVEGWTPGLDSCNSLGTNWYVNMVLYDTISSYNTVNDNPQNSPSTLTAGDEWNVSWLVNATGTIGESYEVDTFFNSSLGSSNVPDNDTEDRTVEITSPYGTLDVSIDYPTDNLGVAQNTTFYINATVNCSGSSGQTCGTVYATARYNKTTSSADENISIIGGATPLYILGKWNWTNISSWDVTGDGNTDIGGITTDGTNIWTTDQSLDQVFKWDMDGNYISDWDTAANGNTFLWGITTDGTNIWTTDYIGGQVYKWTMAGSYVTDWDTDASGNTIPRGITTDGTNIWTIESTDDKVFKWTMDGTAVTSWSSAGHGNNARGMTTDGTNIWTIEHTGPYIYKWDMDGNYINGIWDTGDVGDGETVSLAVFGDYMWTSNNAAGTVTKWESIGENPQSSTLSSGDSWNVSFLVNATGTIGESYEVDAFFNSSLGSSNVADNDTEDRTICIGTCSSLPTYTEFDGIDTTDFTLEGDLTAVSKPTLHNSNAKITWLGTINSENENYDANIQFEKGSVYVNTAGLHSSINSSANITMYNLPYVYNPIIYKDGSVCPSNICEIISYSGGTLIFNVTEFSTYTVDLSLNVTISTPGNTNYTTQNITMSLTANGTALTNITDWRLNGTSIAVLNMPFDTNVSTTGVGDVRDYSTYENNGTRKTEGSTYPTWVTNSIIGGGYYFNASKQEFIEIPDDPSLEFGDATNDKPFTVMAWIYPVTNTAEYAIVNKAFSGTTATPTWTFGIDTSKKFGLRLWDANVANRIESASVSALQMNKWYHVVATYNGNSSATGMKLYLNGTLISDVDGGAGTYVAMHDYASEVRIGSIWPVVNPIFFNGSIDDVMIFNKELSSDQIQAIYDAGAAGKHLETIVSNETKVDDQWSVRVTPNNASDDGVSSSSLNMTILASGNSAPTSPTITLDSIDGLNLTTSTLNCSATITDPESDNLNVTVYWYENSTLKVEVDYNNSYVSSTAFNATLASSNTNKDDAWHCSLNITDGNLVTEANSSSMTILNTAPTDPTTLATESPIYVGDGLNATASGSTDVDTTDTVVYHYAFYASDGSTLQALSSSDTYTLTASEAHDIINVTAYAYDGTDYSSNYVEANQSVSNTVPSTPTITLESIDGLNLSSSILNCSATITDIDTDNLNATVRWYENGTLKLEADYNSSWSSGTAFNATLASSYTNRYDNWTCAIVLSDAYSTGSYGNSTNLTILDEPPTILTSRTIPTTAYSYNNLIGYCNGSDTEGDDITYYYRWYVNGSINETGNTASSYTHEIEINVANLSKSLTGRGDQWILSCMGNDGIRNGSWTNSSIKTISNSQPSFYTVAEDLNTLFMEHFESAEGTTSNNGTYSGISYSSGKYNNAVLVDSTDSLTYPTVGNLNTDTGTIEMWIKPTWEGGDNQRHYLFDEQGTAKKQNRIQLLKDNQDFITCRIDDSSQTKIEARTTATGWVAGGWHHVACTWDNAVGVKLYIDGILVAEDNTPFTITASETSMHIGTDTSGAWEAEAMIDELRISNITRTSFNTISPISPRDKLQIELNRTNFNWSYAVDPDGDSIKYNLLVDDNSDFSSVALNITDIIDANYTMKESEGLPEGTYYWKIIPSDASKGDESNETWEFTLDYIPPNILDSTYLPNPVYNDNDVTFYATIIGAEYIWYGGTWEDGSWKNYSTGIQNSGNNYNVTINAGNFSNQEIVQFRFYGNKSGGDNTTGELLEFTVQNRPPTKPILTSPTNKTLMSKTYTYLNWTNVTDADGDAFNFTVYGSTIKSNVTDSYLENIIYNGTALSFNWSGLSYNTYYWKVEAFDGYTYNSSTVNEFTIEFNNIPNTPIVTINSLDMLNLTSSTLNCSANITDADGTNLNVTVRWYENSTLKLEVDYNNSYANETNFNATLASSYTQVGDNWSCSIRLKDKIDFSLWGESINLTILNSGPIITDIATRTYTPNEGTTKTVYVLFNVTDEDGYADIDPTDALANITKNGVTRFSSSCVDYSSWTGGNNRGINCSIGMTYYDESGNWNISVFANDTANNIAIDENSTELTYNPLAAMSLETTLIAFSGSAGDSISGSDDPIILNNTGNVDFNNVNITGYPLNYSTNLIGPSNFTINVSDAVGQEVRGTITITNAILNRNSIENLYIYLNIPTGLPVGTYSTNSTTQWNVEVYN